MADCACVAPTLSLCWLSVKVTVQVLSSRQLPSSMMVAM